MSIVGGSKTLLVALLLAASVFTDLKTRKVPNRLLGLALLIFLSFAFLTEGFSIYSTLLGSFAAAIACALPLYFIKAMAAGDAKLIIVMSLLMSWQSVVTMCFCALVWGALLGVFKMATSGQLKVLLSNLQSILRGEKPEAQKLTAIPFTVAIAFGFASAMSLSFWGIRWI